MKERDKEYFVEWLLWRGNLAVFFISLFACIILLAYTPMYYAVFPASIMLISFALGYYFVLRIPGLHWKEFFNAMAHGEMLLIVGHPKYDLYRVDKTMRKRHPEAINGGVSWKL